MKLIKSKKALFGEFIADFYAYLAFALIIIIFLVLFYMHTSGAKERMIKDTAYLDTDQVLMNYLRTPVSKVWPEWTPTNSVIMLDEKTTFSDLIAFLANPASSTEDPHDDGMGTFYYKSEDNIGRDLVVATWKYFDVQSFREIRLEIFDENGDTILTTSKMTLDRKPRYAESVAVTAEVPIPFNKDKKTRRTLMFVR